MLPVGDATITTSLPSFNADVHSTTAPASFSPGSYPSNSPLLPPPPPPDATDSGSVRSNHPTGTRLIDVKGEIISSLNQHGTGWTRHTRVYGGGVCLACVASRDRDGAGGYYGATVTPEEMQQDAYMERRSNMIL